MKTGIELIAEERREQVEKHGRTIVDDVLNNDEMQLSVAAESLLKVDNPQGTEIQVHDNP